MVIPPFSTYPANTFLRVFTTLVVKFGVLQQLEVYGIFFSHPSGEAITGPITWLPSTEVDNIHVTSF